MANGLPRSEPSGWIVDKQALEQMDELRAQAVVPSCPRVAQLGSLEHGQRCAHTHARGTKRECCNS